MAPASTHPFLTSTQNPPSSHDNPTRPPTLAPGSSHHARGDTIFTTYPSMGDTILRQYANHVDPIQSGTEIHNDRRPSVFVDDTHHESRQIRETTVTFDEKRLLSPKIGLNPIAAPEGFRNHRKSSGASGIPRQTILKAIASRHSALASPSVAPLGLSSFHQPSPPAIASGQGRRSSVNEGPNSHINPSQLSQTLTNLQLQSPGQISPATASLLKSPCFFHQRFEGLIDVQKVLEETLQEDDYSHSRLMQTATGVREISKQLQRRPLKRAVRNVMIVTRARDNSLVYLTRDLAEWLLSTPRYGSDLGVNVYVDAKLRTSKRFDAAGLIAQNPRYQHMLKYWTPDLCWSSPEKFDLVLTLGGDGTVLFTSWLFQRVVPPVLSFALGSLGFLTNFAFDAYKSHLNDILGDKGMRVNLRMRFTCTVWRQDKSPGAEKGAMEEGDQFEVLNELVIDRGPSAYVSNLELYGDDELLTIVQADGCIFSTPTGSTAYSLSAGGSLIHPSIPAILLTPICPHTLSFRPMVLSDTLALRIAVPHKSRSSAYCSFDGKGRIELKQGDYVTLEASQYPFPTVMKGNNEWVESVQRALRWNVRGAEQRGWGEATDGAEERDREDDEEEEHWDIDIDNTVYDGVVSDSGIGPSEDGDGLGSSSSTTAMASVVQNGFGGGTGSPGRKGASLLNM